MKELELTFVVVTYNSDFYKLKMTLQSIIEQQDVIFDVVISDDGSENDNTEQIINFFQQNNFSNYHIIRKEKNEGTVKNCIRAINESDGEYIKIISPGDYINTTTTMRKWLDYIKDNNLHWSFCDVNYYESCDENIKILNKGSHPIFMKSYKNNQLEAIRYNYLVLGDSVIGASTLCERVLLYEYLKRIEKSVKYAEDYAYRIMIWDGVYPGFFNKKGIFYEIGTGISTNKRRKWTKILHSEWDETSRIILRDAYKNENDRRIQKAINLQLKLKRFGHYSRVIRREIKRIIA